MEVKRNDKWLKMVKHWDKYESADKNKVRDEPVCVCLCQCVCAPARASTFVLFQGAHTIVCDTGYKTIGTLLAVVKVCLKT